MRAFSLAVVVAALLCAGCVKSTSLLSVNKDGSGALIVKESYSPQLAQMMSGMGDMMQGMAAGMQEGLQEAGEQAAKEEAPDTDFIEQSARERAAKMGPGVEMVSFEKIAGLLTAYHRFGRY